MKAISEKDASTLKYAGALGHTFVVIVDSLSRPEGSNEAWKPDGNRRTWVETCDRQGAIRASWEREDLNPAVYQQVKRGQWRRIR